MSQTTNVILNPAYPGSGAGRAAIGTRERLAALAETTKPGITRLVTITAVVGFAMIAIGREGWTFADLLIRSIGVIAGTAISSSGANALNMWLERDRDGLMQRTHGRPLPKGTLRPSTVLAAGLGFSVVGVLVLLTMAGPAAALVGLTCVAVYVLAYTPLKTRTTWNTLVGTVPGALPPIIGAAAASGLHGIDAFLTPMGLALFGIMTVWQIPHFLAIAWMYRDDYAAGGYRMLPVVDPSGRKTAGVILLTSALLLPLSLAPAAVGGGFLSAPYVLIASAAGLGFLALGIRFAIRRDRGSAKALFFGSIMHLPVLLIALVAEGGARAFLGA